jgi:hypothetical protein
MLDAMALQTIGTGAAGPAPGAPPLHPLPPRRAVARPMVRQRPGSVVPRAFTAHRALAARRERTPDDLGPATFSTRPRSPLATAQRLPEQERGVIIPLSTEPARTVPPPPAKLRTNTADETQVLGTGKR